MKTHSPSVAVRICVLIAAVGAIGARVVYDYVEEHKPTTASSDAIWRATFEAKVSLWVDQLQHVVGTVSPRPARRGAAPDPFAQTLKSLSGDPSAEARRDELALDLYLKRPLPAATIAKIPSFDERELWRELGAASTPVTAANRMEAMSASWNLGWWREMLLAGAYQKVGSPAAAPYIQRAQSSAATVGGATAAAGLLFVLIGLAGIVLAVLAAIFWKKLPRPGMPLIRAPSLALAESAVFWVLLLVYGGLLWYPLLGLLPRSARLPGVVLANIATGVLGMVFMQWWLRRNDYNVSIFHWKRPWSPLKDAGWGILGYIALTPFMFLAALLSSRAMQHIPETSTPTNPAILLLTRAHSPLNIVLIFVLACVLAPIFEERFFRGALYPALRSRMPVWLAATITGLCFAALHPQLPLGFLPIAVIGGGFCLIYELRGTTLSSIVAHAINNTLILLLVMVVSRA